MADREEEDWRLRNTTRRSLPDYGDDVESEEDYGDDYDEDEDDNNGDDDVANTGLACPFCFEDFDVLGFCCHIDGDHHREARAGICPVCFTKVETNIVAHLINQHETILKMLCKKKICKSGFLSALLILKKQSQDERFPSHLKGSSTVDSFPNMEPDSLLLPFVNNPQPSEKPEITRLSNKTSPRRSNSDDDTLERDINACALPNKDQERAQRVEFVRGLLLSNIFKDDL